MTEENPRGDRKETNRTETKPTENAEWDRNTAERGGGPLRTSGDAEERFLSGLEVRNVSQFLMPY